jgi:hypothetical protein
MFIETWTAAQPKVELAHISAVGGRPYRRQGLVLAQSTNSIDTV